MRRLAQTLALGHGFRLAAKIEAAGSLIKSPLAGLVLDEVTLLAPQAGISISIDAMRPDVRRVKHKSGARELVIRVYLLEQRRNLPHATTTANGSE